MWIVFFNAAKQLSLNQTTREQKGRLIDATQATVTYAILDVVLKRFIGRMAEI